MDKPNDKTSLNYFVNWESFVRVGCTSAVSLPFEMCTVGSRSRFFKSLSKRRKINARNWPVIREVKAVSN